METVRLSDIDAFARNVIENLPDTEGATVLALKGDLGAGKTTLTQAIGRALGVAHTIPSPTFLVMRSYATDHPRFKKLVHIDAYRIEDPNEIDVLGFADLLKEKGTLVIVEWPEKLQSLPQGTVVLELKIAGKIERTIEKIVPRP